MCNIKSSHYQKLTVRYSQVSFLQIKQLDPHKTQEPGTLHGISDFICVTKKNGQGTSRKSALLNRLLKTLPYTERKRLRMDK